MLPEKRLSGNKMIKEFKHKYPDDSELTNEINKDQRGFIVCFLL